MHRLRVGPSVVGLALTWGALAGCFLFRRGSEAEEGVSACPAPAPSPTWTWRTERLSDVTIEVPSTFIQHNSGDVRTRTWRDGPREISLTLTSDAHATRRVSHLVRFCELEVNDQVIEVVESRLDGPTRQLLASVPDVPAGPILLVSVSTPYPAEFDRLRRVVTSIQVKRQ